LCTADRPSWQPEPKRDRDNWQPAPRTPFNEGDSLWRVLDYVCAAVRD